MVSRLYARVFPSWDPPLGLRPRLASQAVGASLTITWLGTAGHIVSTASTTMLIDPYVSRPRLGSLLATRLVPDDAAIARWIPKRVDAVLCGHSHFDHLLDAPRIAVLRSSRILGSSSTAALSRASGVPENHIDIVPPAGKTFQVGDIEVQFVPSLHGRILLGQVPFRGEIRESERVPARAWHYKMGGAFGIFLRTRDVSLYHNGSADLVDAELEGLEADVLLVGLAGRRATPRYLGRLLDRLSPRVVIPTHHDAFFAPLEAGVRLLPGIDIEGFTRDVGRERPAAHVLATRYGEALHIGQRGADPVVVKSS